MFENNKTRNAYKDLIKAKSSLLKKKESSLKLSQLSSEPDEDFGQHELMETSVPT